MLPLFDFFDMHTQPLYTCLATVTIPFRTHNQYSAAHLSQFHSTLEPVQPIIFNHQIIIMSQLTKIYTKCYHIIMVTIMIATAH